MKGISLLIQLLPDQISPLEDFPLPFVPVTALEFPQDFMHWRLWLSEEEIHPTGTTNNLTGISNPSSVKGSALALHIL